MSNTVPAVQKLVLDALADMKAMDVVALDVTHLTSLTDTMIIASGRSSRHVKSIADSVVKATKLKGYQPLSVEGKLQSDWVLVDLTDIVLHVMLPQTRAFYNLEKLWDITAEAKAAESSGE